MIISKFFRNLSRKFSEAEQKNFFFKTVKMHSTYQRTLGGQKNSENDYVHAGTASFWTKSLRTERMILPFIMYITMRKKQKKVSL